MKVNKKSIKLLLLLFLAGFTSCHQQYKNLNTLTPTLSADSLNLHAGDLVFRMGLQGASRVVTAVGGGHFSHVGIVLRADSGWQVIHAVPDEAPEGKKDVVKCEPFETFFLPDRACRGAVLRVRCAPELAEQAAQCAYQKFLTGTEFDHQYDLCDSTKFYCTEMIWHVYRKIGIDLTEGRRHQLIFPGKKTEWYIFPEDIWKNRDLRLIYYWKKL